MPARSNSPLQQILLGSFDWYLTCENNNDENLLPWKQEQDQGSTTCEDDNGNENDYCSTTSDDNDDSTASDSDASSTKFVRFAEEPQVCETISHKNLTTEEREAVWYDNVFFFYNKNMIADTVFLMTTGLIQEHNWCGTNDDDDDDCRDQVVDYDNDDEDEDGNDYRCNSNNKASQVIHCARGLENKTPEGRKRRSKNKKESIHAVLQEQKLQSMEGIFDPFRIADVYLKCTNHCREMAHQLALKDEITCLELNKQQ